MDRSHEKGRLPPGQYVTGRLPVVHVGMIPPASLDGWDLRFFGLLMSPVTFTREEFLALPRREITADLHCVSTFSCLGLRWEGVPTRVLLTRIRPSPSARYVLVHADGGYSATLAVEDLQREDVLIADRLDGEPLSPEHGYPARLVVPHKYSMKSVKWVRAFEFTEDLRPGFWESRGYSVNADPFTEDRFAPGG